MKKVKIYIASDHAGYKMKVKLIIVDSFKENYVPSSPIYFVNEDHIDQWIYSPQNSYKTVKTVFNEDAIE